MPDKYQNELPDFESVVRIPLYFGPDNKRLLGWLHRTNSPQQSNTGVVICPPLALEYMSTYRSMRYVADYFALAGIPSFRFDYHGTGDSSGSNDDGNRLDEWLWSIEQANSEIKRLTGCEKVGLFGLRMGATLAVLASEKIKFDFLVLWAALESGRRYIREIRAVQMTGISQCSENSTSLLEAGGMVYWPETADAISKIDLTKMTPQASRMLVIPRDDLRAKSKLVDGWRASGVNVEQAAYRGSADMLVDVLDAIVPHDSITKIVKWVGEGVETQTEELRDVLHHDAATSALVDVGSTTCCDVKESFVRFGKERDCFAILSEPVAPDNEPNLPIVVIANSGANHRVGPGRLYVTIARELARMGFCSLRIDIPGLGDSIISERGRENRDYIENSSEVIHDAMKSFGVRYQDYRYIIAGLCSGAYASFHAALDLDNVNIVESVLINPLAFYWREGMALEGTSIENFGYWNWYKKAVKEQGSWKKLVGGKANYSELVNTIKGRIKIVVLAKTRSLRVKFATRNETLSELAEGNLDLDLKKLASNNTYLSFVLARSDPGYDILMTDAGKTTRALLSDEKIGLFMIDNTDHTFSKYKPRCNVVGTVVNHIAARYDGRKG